MSEKLRKMLYNLNQLGYEGMLGLILQRFPSPTKVTNVILPSDDVLGRGGDPKPAAQHQIQLQKRGQFLGENCCNFLTLCCTGVKWSAFDSLGQDNSNEPKLTSLACLVPIL